MTQNVIDLVQNMAENDYMPDGLKIETKSGILLYDLSQIVGVDYIEHENDDITIELRILIMKVNPFMMQWINKRQTRTKIKETNKKQKKKAHNFYNLSLQQISLMSKNLSKLLF